MSDAERDAWLREALRHAPDADAAPPSGVSEAILSKARAQARIGAPERSRRARTGAANGLAALWDWLARPPVAAGFASVMAATLVGLMWWDRPMDETISRPPANTAARNDAAPARPPAAPATVAPPAPRREAANPTAPSENKESTRAAADDGDVQRAQRSVSKPSPAADAKLTEPATAAEKRKVEPLAKEHALADQAKNEAPAPFPPPSADREAQAAPSLDAAANDAAKKADESRRSRATDAVGRTAAPPAAQSIAPAARPAAPAVATAPTAPPAAPAPTTASPVEAAPAPFGEFAQRQRALGDLRAKDAAGVAAPAPAQAAAPPTASMRNEVERAPIDKLQQAGSAPVAGAATHADAAARSNTTARADSPARSGSAIAAPPPVRLLAAIAADPARWSRRTAAGQEVALDADWRAWLHDLDIAAAGRWRALDGVAGSRAQADAARDGAAGDDDRTTLRLVSDGRLTAVIRVDAASVQLDAAPGSGGGAWQAALRPADADRLRTTSRRLAP